MFRLTKEEADLRFQIETSNIGIVAISAAEIGALPGLQNRLLGRLR
jgi:hypothetical protein